MRSKVFRKSARTLFLVLALTLACAGTAKADSTDPSIKAGGGSTPAAAVTTPDFTIESPTGTSPGTSPGESACDLIQGASSTMVATCVFENEIVLGGVDQTITSLVVDAPGTVTCSLLAGSPFTTCAVAPLSGGGSQVTFSGGSVLFDGAFSLDFETFEPNSEFSVTASTTSTTSAVPEPGTIFLLGVGLLGQILVRRLLLRG